MEIDKEELFKNLLLDAMRQPFSGWDFSYLNNRWFEERPPWNYRQRVMESFPRVQRCLDMGTGGGELLAILEPLPPETYATEAYPPNVPVAQSRLEPLGVKVVPVESQAHLPFKEDFFELVINRHENFIAKEVGRVLKPGGLFITQQVGERDLIEINEWLGVKKRERESLIALVLNHLLETGLEILEQAEATLDSEFYDIGAVVYVLKVVPWQVPGFSIDRYHDRLAALHNHIELNGKFVAHAHRYFIKAKKPDR